MFATNTFVLHTGNRDYVEGKATTSAVALGGAPGCLLIFLIPFLAAGLLTLGMAFFSWFRVVGFTVAAVTDEAIVLEKGIAPDSEGEDDPYLVVAYHTDEAAGGVRFKERIYVSREVYATYNVEDPILVEYIGGSPGNVRLAAAGSNLGEVLFLTVFTCVWNAIVWTVFLSVVADSRKRRRLLRDGSLLTGSVTGFESRVDSDGDLNITVHYRFHAPDGRVLEGKEQSVNNEMKQRPTPVVGTPVAVLYVDERTHALL